MKADNEDSTECNKPNENNLLLKRFTLQIDTSQLNNDTGDKCMISMENNINTEDLDQQLAVINNDEWQFRDSLLKCLYSPDVQYSTSKILITIKLK